MKKIYTKPSLLSETFVAENIMTGDETKERLVSSQLTLWLGSDSFTGISLGDAQTLNTISVKDFN